MMGITDTLESAVSLAQRIYQISYSVLPALFGLFMVLWGIFLNDMDWVLIGAGLAVFLIFGWYTFRFITGKP